MIALDGVCFSYDGAPALENATCRIAAGESVALMGPNGCGKSTFLRVVNGLAHPSRGVYRFDGAEITKKSLADRAFAKAFHQKIGFVFQNPDAQLFCSSVENEIAFAPRQMGLPETEIARRVADCMALMQLEALAARPPYALSGGEKRRVGIACVLSQNPAVLALDEPFNGLDEETAALLGAVLRQLHGAGKTILLATHDRQAAAQLCRRAIRFGADHTLREESL
ncbi:MAG: ABC transporter ATP-binding protein [Oscillospiraceae bacterium]|nr:ABC transporter ATP-binding protein [Oscillospiraceae bacterium]